MTRIHFFLVLLLFSGFCLSPGESYAQKGTLRAQVLNYAGKALNYAGKAYGGEQDPEYMAYDRALRDYLVKRIKEQFGVELDPNRYSGFDLLEIEAFFKCKKSGESFDLFLQMFPRRR